MNIKLERISPYCVIAFKFIIYLLLSYICIFIVMISLNMAGARYISGENDNLYYYVNIKNKYANQAMLKFYYPLFYLLGYYKWRSSFMSESPFKLIPVKFNEFEDDA